MKLSELKTGERGVIVKVNGHGGFRKRIKEMGFVKGNKVKVILNAPLRDPIEYEIIGYKISLRREQAEKIEVISEAEAKLLLSSQENLAALESDDGYMEYDGEKRKVNRSEKYFIAQGEKVKFYNCAFLVCCPPKTD